MSDRLNWFIVPSDTSETTLNPGLASAYDLHNEYVLQRLVYQSREYGINLDWADPNPSAPSVSVVRQSNDGSPIRYDETVAIRIRGGGYLRYSEREYGINLVWSENPVYEWQIAGPSTRSGQPVRLFSLAGLYNTVVEDTLFYDPRRYGINLKWTKDKGKFNDSNWLESLVGGVAAFLSELANLVFEILNRGFGALDFFLTLFGIMLPKRIAIRIVILRDEKGKAVLADERLSPSARADDEQQIQNAIDVLRDCLRNEVNVTMFSTDGKAMWEILPFPAMKWALDVARGGGAFAEDFGRSGAFFRRHAALSRNPFGYGSPVTIFVVREIEGIGNGVSLGPLTDWVLVDRTGFREYFGRLAGVELRPTTPMHEVGHACGLWHKHVRAGDSQETKRRFLMKKGVPRGIVITHGLERAIFRNSRHVTFF